MKLRYYIYIIFIVVYFIFWGLVPMEKDPVYAFRGNIFCVNHIVRSSLVIMFTAILGLGSIELFFFILSKFKKSISRLALGFVLIIFACLSFFISGQNIEVSCNPQYAIERLWYFKIRTIIIETQNPDDENKSITDNYSDKGCFRYYHYKNKNYKVFRGLGFAFNLNEVVH